MQKLFTFLACLMVIVSLNAQHMSSGSKNYSTFTIEQQKRLITPELEANTPEDLRSHPEYGILPYGLPNTNCFEVLSKRTIDGRYYQDLTNPKKFYLEKANGPIHYLNDKKQLVSIDPRLRPVGNGVFTAPFQPQPKSLNVTDRYASIMVNGIEMKFNRNLHLWHEAPDGTRTDLGVANWSNRIVGEDGMQAIDVWNGVNMHISYQQKGVKTDFQVYKAPTQKDGYLVITDDLDIPNGYYLTPDPNNQVKVTEEGILGNILIMNQNDQNIFSMGSIYVYDAKIEKKRQRYFPYKIHNENHQYEIRVPLSYFNDPIRKYPVTIDPTVTGPVATYNGGDIPFTNGGAGYGTFNTAVYCSGTLAVQVPANATLTNAYYATRYTALDFFGNGCSIFSGDDCWMSEAAFEVFNSNCGSTGGLLNCNDPNPGDCYTINGLGGGTANNPGYVQDPDLVVPTATCNAPSCSAYNVNFQMRTYEYFSCNGGCQTDCHYMPNGIWRMYLEGETLSGTIALSGTVSGTNAICAGESATITTAPVYGVPAYAYSWSNGTTGTNTITVTPAVTTTYTGYVTDACGTQVSGSLTVTVNQPPAPNPTNNSPICPGATLTFSAGGGGTYNWSGPAALTNGTSSNPFITNVSAAAAGTYTVTVVGANTCSATATTTVVINSAPTSLPSSNTPVCTNGTISLTGAGSGGVTPYTYAWAGPGYSSTLQSPNILNATTANTGTYTLTVTGNNNCTATATTFVTVNAAPPITASSNSPVCVGGTINLLGGGGTSYAWTGPSAYSNGSANPSIANVTAANAGVYTVVGTLNGCTASATVNVTVNPLPVASITSNSPLCQNNTLNLSATNIAGATYAWAGPNAFSASGQATSIPNATTAAAGTYSVTVTDGNTCSASFTSSSVVINSVGISLAASITACTNGVLNLAVSPVGGAATYNYNWSGPAFSSTLQNPQVTASATVANQGTYSVTITDGNGCTASASTAVTVLSSLPVFATSNSPVCTNGTINLISGGATTYGWSGPNGYVSALQNPSISNATAINAGVYTVVGVSGSCTASATVNVTINPLPVVSVTTNSPICAGSSLNLSATNIAGAIYAWAGPNTFSGSGQSTSIPNAPLAAAGTYSVTVTDASNCSASYTSVPVIINSATTTVSSNSPVCVGGTLTLSATNAVTAVWTGPSGAVTPPIANVTLADAGTYNVSITDANGCSTVGNTLVVVNTPPTATATSNGTICAGTNLNLSASATGATGYVWSGPNSFSSNVANPTIANATTSATGIYSVTITTASGCTASASATSTVNPGPNAIASSNSPVCLGGTVNLTSSGGTTYAWSGPGNFSSNQQNPSFGNAGVSNAGTYTVTVTVGSCSSVVTTTVTVGAALISDFTYPLSAYCQTGGTAVPILLNNGMNGTYSANPATLSINNATGVINLGNSPVGTYTVYNTLTSSGGCTGDKDSVVISIGAPQNAAFTYGTNTFCQTGGTNPTSSVATGNYSYTAVDPTDVLFINPTTGTINLSASSVGVYQVCNSLPASGGCAADTACQIIVIEAAPNAEFTYSTTSFCKSAQNPDVFHLLGGTDGIYTSTPAGLIINANNGTIDLANSAAGTYIITNTVASGVCAVAIATQTVTITNTIDAEFSYDKKSYCKFGTDPVVAHVTGVNGVYTYIVSSGGPTLALNPATGDINLSLSDFGTYEVRNTIPASGGCPASTHIETIVIENGPDAEFHYDKTTYCGNQEIPTLLHTTGVSGVYSYVATSGGPTLLLNPTTGDINLNLSDYGTYTIKNVVNGSGACAADSETVTITYAAPPTAVISPTGVIDLCAAGTVQLQAGGGLNYQWIQNNIPVLGATTASFAANTAGNYMVIVYGAFGCADTSQIVSLNNQTLPQANITANGSTTFCANNGVTLSTNLTGNYEWLRNGVATGITTPQLYVTDGANYQVIVTNFCGTDTSVIVKTQIAPAPVPNFNWQPDYVYTGQPVVFTDSSQNAATWSWNFGDSHILYAQNPTNTYNEPGEYVVWMHIWDAFGCDSFIAKNLTVHNPDAYFLPNVFSPDGDGSFDTWQIDANGFKTFYVEIFDRWGTQMFQSNDPAKSWNGTTPGGRACQSGVYFYYLNLTDSKGEKIELKGNITLMR